MKILIVHNFHRSNSTSGDDVIVRNEIDLLKQYGHDIVLYTPCNDEFDNANIFRKIFLGIQMIWSFETYFKIRKIIDKEKPDIVHAHTFFPLVSPSVFYACQSKGVPVVQTLDDFRLMCPSVFFLRDGKICEECKGGKFFKSLKRKCVKGSFVQTFWSASMLKINKWIGTFRNKVDKYICFVNFQKDKFIKQGYDKDKFCVKANFLINPLKENMKTLGDYVVFIGRLDKEKGLDVLLSAWKQISKIPLKIVGSGVNEKKYKEYIKKEGIKNIEFLGYKSNKESLDIISNSRFLVMPSIWYETFGLVIIEAFSCCKPAIVSRLGAMAELVEDDINGYTFNAGDSKDLASKVEALWNDKQKCLDIGLNARKIYEKKYTPEVNYKILVSIYNLVIKTYYNKSNVK